MVQYETIVPTNSIISQLSEQGDVWNKIFLPKYVKGLVTNDVYFVFKKFNLKILRWNLALCSTYAYKRYRL